MVNKQRQPLRTAVIGYGLAGSAFHAPLIAATDGLVVTAIVTGNADRTAAARDRYPGVVVLSSADELWRAPELVDLVVIASPNQSHLSLGLSALGAGLPVVIDKPIAATVAAAEQLQRAAAGRGLMLSVFHNRRWDGDLRTAVRLIEEGVLGTVHRLESRFERWRPALRAGSWREDPAAEEAGGLLYDLGSHLIDQALVLLGPVRSVYAELRLIRPGAQVEDDVFLALSHADGGVSHLWASAVTADIGPRLRVLGSTAAYVKYGLDGQEVALRAGGAPGDVGWGREPQTNWGRLGTPEDSRPVATEAGAYEQYYAGVRDALLAGTQPPVTIEQAIEVLKVIEAAQHSGRTGSTIAVA